MPFLASPIVSDDTTENQGGTSHSKLSDSSMKLAEDPEPVAGPSQLDKNGDTSFVRRSERKKKTVSYFAAGEEDSDDEYDLDDELMSDDDDEYRVDNDSDDYDSDNAKRSLLAVVKKLKEE